MVPTVPAIANAIYDAVGVRLEGPPFTSEKVYFAMLEAGIIKQEPGGAGFLHARRNRVKRPPKDVVGAGAGFSKTQCALGPSPREFMFVPAKSSGGPKLL